LSFKSQDAGNNLIQNENKTQNSPKRNLQDKQEIHSKDSNKKKISYKKILDYLNTKIDVRKEKEDCGKLSEKTFVTENKKRKIDPAPKIKITEINGEKKKFELNAAFQRKKKLKSNNCKYLYVD